jgi:UDP-N-acetylmuramyl pentapeptide phosphotransferase/UDP-N-acetylglucosamine-1-phosphate transferase
MDHPGERHSHDRPTPRGGGAGVVLAIVVATYLFSPQTLPPDWPTLMAPCAGALALLGWWDDHRSPGAALRFAVQAAVSLLLIVLAIRAGWLQGAWLPLAGLLFLLWMTNLFNFMDGSNGMAGLQGVFAGGAMAWLFLQAGDGASALLALLLAAACLGFLPWNFPRARVFMGDVGSLFLGFSIAALLLYGVGKGALTIPSALLVMALFVADATLTLIARVMKGERWYNAHRQHLYQRLIAHGWPHTRVAAFYQAVNLALVLPGIWVAARFPALAWPVTIIVASCLGVGWYVLTKRFGVLAQAG